MERLSKLEGELTPCRCGKQPKALFRFGKQVHALDWPPCGVRTNFWPTLQEAVAEWELSKQETS